MQINSREIPFKMLLLLTSYLPIHSVELFAALPYHKALSTAPKNRYTNAAVLYTHQALLGGKQNGRTYRSLH